MRGRKPLSRARVLHLVAVCLFAASSVAEAQVRGVYPLGLSAINSGVTPEPGLSYSNALLFYSRDELRGANGAVEATGQQAVLMDLNSLVWVFKNRIPALGGAIFSFSATLPIATNSLTSTGDGPVSGGGGFADSFYQPLILAWRTPRADIRLVYGFLAPTGRFSATSSNNVGSGYWTSVVSSGQTWYLTQDKATTISMFEMYELPGGQSGTDIHPGDTFDLDYSVLHSLRLSEDIRVQLGIVGYGQWQTTARTGPTITPAQTAARYRVNALGLAASVILPARNVSVGLKYFHEFDNRSTFQGQSLQITEAITF